VALIKQDFAAASTTCIFNNIRRMGAEGGGDTTLVLLMFSISRTPYVLSVQTETEMNVYICLCFCICLCSICIHTTRYVSVMYILGTVMSYEHHYKTLILTAPFYLCRKVHALYSGLLSVWSILLGYLERCPYSCPRK
jgi:hypothetical protein